MNNSYETEGNILFYVNNSGERNMVALCEAPYDANRLAEGMNRIRTLQGMIEEHIEVLEDALLDCSNDGHGGAEPQDCPECSDLRDQIGHFKAGLRAGVTS